MNSINYVTHFESNEIETNGKVPFSRMHLDAGEHFVVESEPQNRLVFLLKGQVEVSSNQFQPLRVSARRMFFLPVGSRSEITTLEYTEMITLQYDDLLNLSDQLVLENLAEEMYSLKFKFMSVEIRRPLDRFLDLVSEYVRDGVSNSLLYALCQREMFVLFRSYYSSTEIAMMFYPIVSHPGDFKSAVLRHYRSVKNVDELAEACNYSKMTFYRLFRANFNQTPYQWMLEQMAVQVHQRLMNRSLTLKEIIQEFGFSSPAHLNTFCKKYLGGTPHALRRRSSAPSYAAKKDK